MSDQSPAIFLRLNEKDNVVIALKDFEVGDIIDELDLTLKSDVPFGHKIATETIARGEPVRRYGQVVALATEDIAIGAHVHENIKAQDQGSSEDMIGLDARETQFVESPATFMGYKRADGKVGTRKTLDWGIEQVDAMLARANQCNRANRGWCEHYLFHNRPWFSFWQCAITLFETIQQQ